LAPIILGDAAPTINQTPDQVENRLHVETIATWKNWLADLRVQPFNNRDRAILISGALSQKTNPLTQLLSEVWVQVGGRDRKRTHPQQIELGREFGPMIQYVEQGGMDGIRRVFSSLNVALGSIDIDQKRGIERLMSVQDRARSVNVLQTAPLIVVQIAEDVFAQTSAAQNDEGGDPLTAGWQSTVYPLCRAALDGLYPFADGPDADPVDVMALLSSTGPLMQFYQTYAEPYIDQSSSPWRWKPEARFSGLDPESAAFFERAVFVSQALFDAEGGYTLPITLAALAERGNTLFALGGTGVPVRATGEPAALVWPGPDPSLGVAVSFRAGVDAARIAEPGFWGLLRLLDQFRLRFRDEGQRVLVDLRTNDGRVFVELTFAAAANLVSARAAFRNFSCPPQL
jgi:type VI protein secretion system component VasK